MERQWQVELRQSYQFRKGIDSAWGWSVTKGPTPSCFYHILYPWLCPSLSSIVILGTLNTTEWCWCHCSPLLNNFKGKNTARSLLHLRWKLHVCSLVYLGLILATAKRPGMSNGEQGVKNQFKGMSLLISHEPLKQLCEATFIKFTQNFYSKFEI